MNKTRNKQPLPLNPNERLAYRVDEAIRATGIRRTKLYQLIKSKKLKSVERDGLRLIDGESLRSYVCGEAA